MAKGKIKPKAVRSVKAVGGSLKGKKKTAGGRMTLGKGTKATGVGVLKSKGPGGRSS